MAEKQVHLLIRLLQHFFFHARVFSVMVNSFIYSKLYSRRARCKKVHFFYSAFHDLHVLSNIMYQSAFSTSKMRKGEDHILSTYFMMT